MKKLRFKLKVKTLKTIDDKQAKKVAGGYSGMFWCSHTYGCPVDDTSGRSLCNTVGNCFP